MSWYRNPTKQTTNELIISEFSRISQSLIHVHVYVNLLKVELLFDAKHAKEQNFWKFKNRKIEKMYTEARWYSYI